MMNADRVVHLVDDEEAIRKSAGFVLSRAGYKVHPHNSGVEFLQARHAPIGCVLLDVRMPDMDGLEVQRVMAERGINMPVIVLTGHGDVTTAVQAMKAGAVEFLEKPFEKASLLEALERAFGRLEQNDAREIEEREARTKIAALTPREREILEGLAKGYPNKTIAYDLGARPARSKCTGRA
jgi:two-component system response regulator FixJ